MRGTSTPADCTVRAATAGDAEAVTDVLVRARSASEAEGQIPPAIHNELEIRAWVRDALLATRQVWIAEVDSVAIGVLVLDAQWVDQLYVRPDAQGQGVGTLLLAQARRACPRQLQLWVFQSNTRAITFYANRGFVVVESTDGAGNEEQAPDHRMLWLADRADGAV